MDRLSGIQHELVQAIKELAIELGRTPTRGEFEESHHGAHNKLKKIFGGYSALVLAAGLEQSKRGAKVTNDIFTKNIETHLAGHEPRGQAPYVAWPKIAILGDLHEPFSHPGVKSAFIEFCRKEQPEYVVQAGDSMDQYSSAKFPKSHNVFTPKQEEDLARDNLEKFWSNVREACPEAKCVMLTGNHCIRPIKRVLESAPSIEHWAEAYLKDLLTFDGVHTVIDPREEYRIADIIFIHGFRSKLGEHRDYLQANVVCGHTHLGGVSFKQINGRTLFELNAGLAGDPESKGLSHTPSRIVNWTLGWGWIDQYGPRFIPYRVK